MKRYFGYTRVSTVKQGEGVSLEAQKDAITEYARKHDLTIFTWYEEKETAAKRGRPLFSAMLTALRRGEAEGLIIHKIDRSARNPYDWAAISELLDQGVDVRFAHESLDLHSRGGRITADIQAVIAADYVRNLREECLKGIEGRLKQGLFPFGAPIGYLDQGAGKPKIPDPERAPYVRQAFELYATMEFSIQSLLTELQRRGFRNRGGKPITKGCLENLLNNQFYNGTIYMKRTGRTYSGIHEPLISRRLFNRVQQLKSNKYIKKSVQHDHMFRRIISCDLCGRSLYGELQKGHVYMRCQTASCPTKSVRQDRLDAEIAERLRGVTISQQDHERLERVMLSKLKKRNSTDDRKALDLQLANVVERTDRLTDALLDDLIDKPTFEERRHRLLEEKQALSEALKEIGETTADERLTRKFLELSKTVGLLYQMANPRQKRRLTEMLFSNRTLKGKNLCLTPQKWLVDVPVGIDVLCGPPDRDTARTKREVIRVIEELTTEDEFV